MSHLVSEEAADGEKQSYLNFRNFLSAQKAGTEEKEPIQAEVSPSEELRQQGNNFFNLGIYDKAIIAYGIALESSTTDEEKGKLYSNRSAAYLKEGGIENKKEALNDAREAVQLCPNWNKSYGRLVTALVENQIFDEAKEVLEKGKSIGLTGCDHYLIICNREEFYQKVKDKRYTQTVGGMPCIWEFKKDIVIFNVMKTQITGKWELVSEKKLSVSTGTKEMKPQIYEFYWRNEIELWMKSDKEDEAQYFPEATLDEETGPKIESAQEYVDAWFELLPATPEECVLTVPTDNDTPEMVQGKTQNRLQLVQKLHNLKNRSTAEIHVTAMNTIKRRENEMCSDICDKMIALQMLHPDDVVAVKKVIVTPLEIDTCKPSCCCPKEDDHQQSTGTNTPVEPLSTEGKVTFKDSGIHVEPLTERNREVSAISMASPERVERFKSQESHITDERFYGEADDEEEPEDDTPTPGEIDSDDELSPEELATLKETACLNTSGTNGSNSRYECEPPILPSEIPLEVLEAHEAAMEDAELARSASPTHSEKRDEQTMYGSNRPWFDGKNVSEFDTRVSHSNKFSIMNCFQGFGKICGFV